MGIWQGDWPATAFTRRFVHSEMLVFDVYSHVRARKMARDLWTLVCCKYWMETCLVIFLRSPPSIRLY